MELNNVFIINLKKKLKYLVVIFLVIMGVGFVVIMFFGDLIWGCLF